MKNLPGILRQPRRMRVLQAVHDPNQRIALDQAKQTSTPLDKRHILHLLQAGPLDQWDAQLYQVAWFDEILSGPGTLVKPQVEPSADYPGWFPVDIVLPGQGQPKMLHGEGYFDGTNDPYIWLRCQKDGWVQFRLHKESAPGAQCKLTSIYRPKFD